jgi:integrase
MLGLRWDDLDLESTTTSLQVKRTLQETRSGHEFELPKRAKGRSIELSEKAADTPESHRARQAGSCFSALRGRRVPSSSRPRRERPRSGRTLWDATLARY